MSVDDKTSPRGLIDPLLTGLAKHSSGGDDELLGFLAGLERFDRDTLVRSCQRLITACHAIDHNQLVESIESSWRNARMSASREAEPRLDPTPARVSSANTPPPTPKRPAPTPQPRPAKQGRETA